MGRPVYKVQIGPHFLNYWQTHSETAECTGDVFLKGNPGASEREGTTSLTRIFHLPEAVLRSCVSHGSTG